MNWLDILLIIIILICFIGGIILSILAFADYEVEAGIGYIIGCMVISVFFLLLFLVIDKHSGATIGTITSVDKNFFGTTAIYVKTTENKEEEYCIEFDEELETQANKYIGKKVKISYGKRVGFYSTGKCSQAPIEKIELLENN